MTTPTAREQERMVRTHACRECGAPLAMPYDPSTGARTLACTRDRTHEGFTRAPSLTQRYERGEGLPVHMTNRIEDRRREQVTQALSIEQRQALAPYQGVRSLTQEAAAIVLRTIWPKAPDADVLKAAILCKDFGLHPLMKHVYLLPFKTRTRSGGWVITWAIALGIQATRLMAARQGPYSYVDGPRLMTEQEQIATFGEVHQDKLWAITVVQDAAGNRAPGYGFWPKDKEAQGTDKGNSKANMAFIRSERQALGRLRPGDMPTGFDVVDAAYLPDFGGESAVADAPALPEAGASENGDGDGESEGVIDVDPETGEVLNAPASHTPSAATDVTNSEQPELLLEPPSGSPLVLNTPGDLFTAAYKRYELTKPAVLAIPHVKGTIEAGNYATAWEIIQAHQQRQP